MKKTKRKYSTITSIKKELEHLENKLKSRHLCISLILAGSCTVNILGLALHFLK